VRPALLGVGQERLCQAEVDRARLVVLVELVGDLAEVRRGVVEAAAVNRRASSRSGFGPTATRRYIFTIVDSSRTNEVLDCSADITRADSPPGGEDGLRPGPLNSKMP
jgi:hypothetical protein